MRARCSPGKGQAPCGAGHQKTTIYTSKVFSFIKAIAEAQAAQGVKCIKQFTINIELIPEISTREYNRAINPLIH